MNFKKHIVTLAATVALTTGSAFAAQAEPGQKARGERSRGEKRMMRHHAGGLASALNFTDAQKEQAKAIRQKHRSANEGLRTELRNVHEQIRAAREAKNIAEAQRLASLREPLLVKAQEARQAERDELTSILTAEQKTKLEESRKAHAGKRQFRRG